jgi:hypothetical protein
MSIRLMARCFESDIPVEGTEQVLLLKLCDLANDDGWCWPSVAALARAIRRQDRQTRNLLQSLIRHGLIRVSIGTGPHHTNRYLITLPAKPEVTDAGSTRNMTRQPVAGGNGLQGAADRREPRQPATCPPCNPLTSTPAIAAAANPSEIHQRPPTHPPGQPGGGGGRDDSSPAGRRMGQRELFRTALMRLGVADGDRALDRWWRIAEGNALVRTFDDHCDCVTWCVLQARERGRVVNHASDIAALVAEWIPEGLLDDGAADAAPTPAA